jgi:uncharacterized glyoxalase superfamily protein PhnB
MIKKLTPILFVKAIEPVLPFWIDRLGLEKTIEVPEGDRLGFVILERGNIELMYQTYDSVDRDMPELASAVRKQAGFLYLEVENLEAIKRAVQDAEVYMTERTTFYGTREIGVKDPAGHFITFAQIGEQAAVRA